MTALAEATKADDGWATAWALHVLTYTAAMQGRITDALPLYDRALAVTQAEPGLTDLRLLLQINKAVTLGDLDQYDGAFAAARQAQQLADRAGIMVRRAQAHCCLGELLFNTGHWDDALTEVGVVREVTKDPGVACCDHGVAAVISIHRGDIGTAQCHLAAAAPHAERIGNRVVGTLALARSEALEQEGSLTEALDVLTSYTDHAEELDEVEDLLADGVRLATTVGDTAIAETLADRAAALAHDSEIPHRQANALCCRGFVDHDAGGSSGPRSATTRPVGRCWAPRRWRPRPGPSWKRVSGPRPGPRSAAPSTSTPRSARPVTSPGCRPGSGPTASAAPPGSSTGGPARAGTA